MVFFKWKETTTATDIENAINALKTLQHRVPGVLSLTVGNTITERGKGFKTGLVVRLESREALAAYGPNPDHQDVNQNYILPVVEEVIAIDYEIS